MVTSQLTSIYHQQLVFQEPPDRKKKKEFKLHTNPKVKTHKNNLMEYSIQLNTFVSLRRVWMHPRALTE